MRDHKYITGFQFSLHPRQEKLKLCGTEKKTWIWLTIPKNTFIRWWWRMTTHFTNDPCDTAYISQSFQKDSFIVFSSLKWCLSISWNTSGYMGFLHLIKWKFLLFSSFLPFFILIHVKTLQFHHMAFPPSPNFVSGPLNLCITQADLRQGH